MKRGRNNRDKKHLTKWNKDVEFVVYSSQNKDFLRKL